MLIDASTIHFQCCIHVHPCRNFHHSQQSMLHPTNASSYPTHPAPSIHQCCRYYTIHELLNIRQKIVVHSLFSTQKNNAYSNFNSITKLLLLAVFAHNVYLNCEHQLAAAQPPDHLPISYWSPRGAPLYGLVSPSRYSPLTIKSYAGPSNACARLILV